MNLSNLISHINAILMILLIHVPNTMVVDHNSFCLLIVNKVSSSLPLPYHEEFSGNNNFFKLNIASLLPLPGKEKQANILHVSPELTS